MVRFPYLCYLGNFVIIIDSTERFLYLHLEFRRISPKMKGYARGARSEGKKRLGRVSRINYSSLQVSRGQYFFISTPYRRNKVYAQRCAASLIRKKNPEDQRSVCSSSVTTALNNIYHKENKRREEENNRRKGEKNSKALAAAQHDTYCVCVSFLLLSLPLTQ